MARKPTITVHPDGSYDLPRRSRFGIRRPSAQALPGAERRKTESDLRTIFGALKEAALGDSREGEDEYSRLDRIRTTVCGDDTD